MYGSPEGGRFTGTAWTPGAAVGTAPGQPPPRPVPVTLEAKLQGGQLTAVLPAPGSGRVRYIHRITVSTPGALTGLRAYVYVGPVAPETLVMGTRSGQLDYALENPPLFVPEETALTVQWDAGPTRALARIEYTEV